MSKDTHSNMLQPNNGPILGGASTLSIINALCNKLDKDKEGLEDEKYTKYLNTLEPLIRSACDNIKTFIHQSYKGESHYFNQNVINIDRIIDGFVNKKQRAEENGNYRDSRKFDICIKQFTTELDSANFRDLLYFLNKRLSYFTNRVSKDKKINEKVESLKDDVAGVMFKQRNAWNSFIYGDRPRNNRENGRNYQYNNRRNYESDGERNNYRSNRERHNYGSNRERHNYGSNRERHNYGSNGERHNYGSNIDSQEYESNRGRRDYMSNRGRRDYGDGKNDQSNRGRHGQYRDRHNNKHNELHSQRQSRPKIKSLKAFPALSDQSNSQLNNTLHPSSKWGNAGISWDKCFKENAEQKKNEDVSRVIAKTGWDE